MISTERDFPNETNENIFEIEFSSEALLELLRISPW